MLRPGLDFEIPTVEILEKYLEATWESEGLGLKRKEYVVFFFCLASLQSGEFWEAE